MKRQRWVFAAAMGFLLTAAARSASAGMEDVEALLKVMPGDAPVIAVIVNPEKFDKALIAAVKGIEPSATFAGILADIKDDLPIAGWVDLTKPLGLVQPVLGGGKGVLIATAPGFTEKVKGVADAKEENGVWSIPFEGGKTIYAKVKGGFVLACDDANGLALADKGGTAAAEAFQGRLELLKDRDAVLHFNFEPIRPMALMGIAGLSQYAPMLGMMSAAQGGDPAAVSAVVTGLVDGLKNLVEQFNYLDIVIGVTESNATVTLAAGFKDGGIRTYLAKQKPAGAKLLADVEEQPYLVAMGCHFPGTESPFFDYFLDKIWAAMTGGPAMPGTPPPDPAKVEAAKTALQTSRDLFRKVEGWNSIIALTQGGMRVSGDYLGADAPGILDLAKKNLMSANPVAKSFSGGASYEPAGTSKIGDASVDQFTIKLHTSNPAMAQAAMLMGADSKFSMGIAGGRVRYCMGTDQDAQRTFAAKTEKPFASNKLIADALAALPANRNVVLLLDPSGVLPFVGPMMGRPPSEPLPPGPPVGISVSLSGEPARLDLVVPFKAISRLVEALKPPPPPTTPPT